ncbi:hypothetical protein [Burkholderia glumae]|uniref:hypothetical protein n=1 Tax=Burkholderia glumae TaxID=337 RepID=UPI00216430B3|nr:hypothetical protein [Burkholderia glumae]UVS95683.1 hypothetical protein EFP19_07795 [Burkholderia glumae]
MSESKHPEKQVIAVRDALAQALGDTYDCTRVWSAWGYGTMGEDDFSPIAEDDHRLQELAFAALEAGGVPELVEAAKKLVDMYDAHFSLTDYSAFEISKHYVDELADAFEAARAALAKAGA